MAEIALAPPGHQPAVAGFRGTHWLVVWADPDQAAIKGQVLHAGSDTAGAQFVVNASQEGNTVRQLPVVCNIGGGLVAVWVESALTPPGPRPHVKARRFDSDGRPVGPDLQVSVTDVDPACRPAVAATGDGGFTVTWMDARPDQRVQTRRFRFDGTPGGTPFTFNQTAGFHKNPMVIRLVGESGAAGNGLCAWVRDPAHVEGANVVGRFFDRDAVPIDHEITPNLFGFRNEDDVSAIAALDTGQFVITHIRHRDNPEPGVTRSSKVEWQIFEPDGKPTDISGFAGKDRLLCSSPRVAPLPDGRFLLTWIQKSAVTVDTTPTVMGRLFSVTGVSFPAERSISSDETVADRRNLTVGAIFDGDAGEAAFVAWTNVNHAGATSGRGRQVRFSPSGEVIL